MTGPRTDVSVRSTLTRNTAFNAAGRLWEAAASLVLLRYVIDTLGNASFGLWALLGAFTGYVALLDFGIGTAYVKHIAEHAARDEQEELSAVVTTGFIYYLAFGTALVAVGWPLADVIARLGLRAELFAPDQLDEVRFLIRWGLVLFSATGAMAAFGSVQVGLQRMDISNLLSFGASLIKIAATVFFLEQGHGVRGLLYAQALAFGGFGIASVIAARRLVPGLRFTLRHARWRTFRRLFGFGLRTQVAKFANLVMFETDKVVAGFWFGSLGLVTVYEIGVTLANKMRQIPTLLISAIVPAAADLDARDRQDQLRRLYLISTKYVAVVAAPLVAFTAGSAGILIRAWMGDGYEQSAWVLRIIAVGYVANILPGAGVGIALGKGRPDLQMKAGIIATVSNIGLTLLFVWRVGFWGIPLATALSMGISWAWFLHAMRPVVAVSVRQLTLTCLAWPAAAALPAFVLCACIDAATHGVSGLLPNLALAAGCAAATALLYLALIRALPFFDAYDFEFMGDTLRLRRAPGFRLWAGKAYRA